MADPKKKQKKGPKKRVANNKIEIARLRRIEIEKAKKTIEYQRMINNNRKEYGLKQKKVQLNMKSYFKSKTSSSS